MLNQHPVFKVWVRNLANVPEGGVLSFYCNVQITTNIPGCILPHIRTNSYQGSTGHAGRIQLTMNEQNTRHAGRVNWTSLSSQLDMLDESS